MHGERCLVLPRQANWSGCARIALAATVLSLALCGAAYPQLKEGKLIPLR